MRRVFTLLLATLTIGTLVSAAAPAADADGIGIFPATISYNDVLRDGTYFTSVGVVNDSDKERTFQVEALGEVAPWIAFVQADNRDVPTSSVVVPPFSDGFVLAKLTVPSEAGNGDYTGIVRVITNGQEGEFQGAGASVTIGAEASVSVAVSGTQRLGGSLVDTLISDTEVGQPLRVQAIFRNDSNVTVRPELTFSLSPAVGAEGGRVSVPAEATVLGPDTTEMDQTYPDETATLVHEVATDNLEPGSYFAHVSLSFASFDAGAMDVPVEIHPRGTLTRQGTLLGLKLLNQPIAGGAAKVEATFLNTGQIDSHAVFVGELYRGSDLLTAVTGLEKLVPSNQQDSLEIFLDIPSDGSYVLKGRVSFEGKETDPQELTFDVGAASRSGTSGRVPLPLYVAIAVVVSGVFTFGAFRLTSKPRRQS